MPRTPNSANGFMLSHGKVPSIQRAARSRNLLWASSRTVETKRRCSSVRLGNTGSSSLDEWIMRFPDARRETGREVPGAETPPIPAEREIAHGLDTAGLGCLSFSHFGEALR